MHQMYKEGYMLGPDPSTAVHYFETNGQTYVYHELEAGVSSYVAPASAQELSMLGFTNAEWGQHVLVKVITTDNGVSTERITRITTAKWTDGMGQSRSSQVLTLQGFHQKQ
jgi:hypothetical protein